jgi:hypothetical protein
MTTAALEVTQNIIPLRCVTLPGTALPLLRGFQPSSSSPHRRCMQASATLSHAYHPSGSDCVKLLLHTCKPMTYTMAHRLPESSDDAAVSPPSLSMAAHRAAAMCAAIDIVSLRSSGCEMSSGDYLREILPRRTGNGKAEKVPSPADGAGTPAGHDITGRITGNRGQEAVCRALSHAHEPTLSS